MKVLNNKNGKPATKQRQHEKQPNRCLICFSVYNVSVKLFL